MVFFCCFVFFSQTTIRRRMRRRRREGKAVLTQNGETWGLEGVDQEAGVTGQS